jgi:hypothetical protein
MRSVMASIAGRNPNASMMKSTPGRGASSGLARTAFALPSGVGISTLESGITGNIAAAYARLHVVRSA